MKDSITIRAQTVDEAVRLALEHLGLDEGDVEIEVLEEGGPGPDEAMVRVTRKESAAVERGDPLEIGRQILVEVFRRMDTQADVAIGEYAVIPGERQRILEVSPADERDTGLLIGRRGETLYHLQFLLNLMVSRRLHRWPYIVVDVEGYRRRRDSSLRDLAQRMAERVRQSQNPITLEPMTAYERRIVHLTLRDDPDLFTESTGEGDSRKVVIYPSAWKDSPTFAS